MYLDKYIEAAFKMRNFLQTDSVLIAPEVEFLGTKHCQLSFCLALLAFIGLSWTLKAK